MAELYPARFNHLLKRIYHEYRNHQSIFDFPSTKFYRPNPKLDLSVSLHKHHAGTPLGPAAGPHTQLAQNILLSWLGGSRIIELKTVQILDNLEINRPCIDIPNIGFNIEWSQELLLDLSVREYIRASMIIEILRHSHLLGEEISPSRYDTLFDMSLGYDLQGIQSHRMTQWIQTMLDAKIMVEELRSQIPEEYKEYRDLNFKTRISDSVTLSTFHGCPKEEIEHIARYLMKEMGLNVVIKLNPTQLPKEELEYILHDQLGYTDLQVNPSAYENAMSLTQACAMMKRLHETSVSYQKFLGVKFTNTLEVINHRDVFKSDKVIYLSGVPLHVIAVQLVKRFQDLMQNDSEIGISFSAGIDKTNFPALVSCGMVPVTVCTDLLKTHGYGRLSHYLKNLEVEMIQYQAHSIHEYILKKNGNNDNSVYEAASQNLEHYARSVLDNPRYKKETNSTPPKKINSKLMMFDCINCDKCIPVCPNNANFSYETDLCDIEYPLYEIKSDELIQVSTWKIFVEKRHQIACFTDFCNDCGNCDTYCPEEGGPYLQKPAFFSSLDTWKHHKDHEGYFAENENGIQRIWGRIQGNEYYLEIIPNADKSIFRDYYLDTEIKTSTHEIVSWEPYASPPPGYILDLKNYHILRILLKSILNPEKINYINMAYL